MTAGNAGIWADIGKMFIHTLIIWSIFLPWTAADKIWSSLLTDALLYSRITPLSPQRHQRFSPHSSSLCSSFALMIILRVKSFQCRPPRSICAGLQIVNAGQMTCFLSLETREWNYVCKHQNKLRHLRVIFISHYCGWYQRWIYKTRTVFTVGVPLNDSPSPPQKHTSVSVMHEGRSYIASLECQNILICNVNLAEGGENRKPQSQRGFTCIL